VWEYGFGPKNATGVWWLKENGRRTKSRFADPVARISKADVMALDIGSVLLMTRLSARPRR
jgi:hypothetical protein